MTEEAFKVRRHSDDVVVEIPIGCPLTAVCPGFPTRAELWVYVPDRIFRGIDDNTSSLVTIKEPLPRMRPARSEEEKLFGPHYTFPRESFSNNQ